MRHGGHFAAGEEPDLLAADIAAFFFSDSAWSESRLVAYFAITVGEMGPGRGLIGARVGGTVLRGLPPEVSPHGTANRAAHWRGPRQLAADGPPTRPLPHQLAAWPEGAWSSRAKSELPVSSVDRGRLSRVALPADRRARRPRTPIAAGGCGSTNRMATRRATPQGGYGTRTSVRASRSRFRSGRCPTGPRPGTWKAVLRVGGAVVRAATSFKVRR